MSINHVVLVGRLTADPETRTAGEHTKTSFRLAVSRRHRDDADYITVDCWNALAGSVGTYLAKGRLVGVSGELRSEEWTKDGKLHSRHVVAADNVQFLDRPATSSNQATTGEEDPDSPADAIAGAAANAAG